MAISSVTKSVGAAAAAAEQEQEAAEEQRRKEQLPVVKIPLTDQTVMQFGLLSKTDQMVMRLGGMLSLNLTDFSNKNHRVWQDLHVLASKATRTTTALYHAILEQTYGAGKPHIQVQEGGQWAQNGLNVYTNYRGSPEVVSQIHRVVGVYFSVSPSYICLAHEMIHALHFLELGAEKMEERIQTKVERYSNLEELETIGLPNESDKRVTENAFRREMRLPIRITHWGTGQADFTEELKKLQQSGELDAYLSFMTVSEDLLPKHEDANPTPSSNGEENDNS